MTATMEQTTFTEPDVVADDIGFTATHAALASALSLAARVASKKPTTLPIIKYVVLDTRDGILRLSSTDMDQWITVPVTEGIKDIQKGVAAVPAAAFLDQLRTLDPKAPVRVHFDRKHANRSRLTVLSGHTVLHLPTQPWDDFPQPNVGQASEVRTIEGVELQNAIRHTAFAAAVNETREALLGVHLTLDESGFHTYASDGFRLALYEWKPAEQGQDAFHCVIPAPAARTIADLAEGVDDVQLTFTPNFGAVVTTFDTGVTYTARLLEARPLDYTLIFQHIQPNTVTISRKELIAAVRRATYFATMDKSGKDIEFLFGDDLFTIRTYKTLDGGSFDVMKNVLIEGDPVGVVIDALKIQGVLDMVPGDTVVLRAGPHVTPLTIEDSSLPEFRFGVMPVIKSGQ